MASVKRRRFYIETGTVGLGAAGVNSSPFIKYKQVMRGNASETKAVSFDIGDAVRVDIESRGIAVEPDACFDESAGEINERAIALAKVRAEAVYKFADAFNRLHDSLLSESASQTDEGLSNECKSTADTLREAVYKPVRLNNSNGRHISIYELGVAHSPDHMKAGRLAVQERKLIHALTSRERDVRTLFVKEGEGLLMRLSGHLSLLSDLIEGNTSTKLKSYRELCELGNLFVDECDNMWTNFYYD